jgi:hypothetical protein
VDVSLEANSKVMLWFMLDISNVDGYTGVTSLEIVGHINLCSALMLFVYWMKEA